MVEKRAHTGEIRTLEENGKKKIVGYAAVFGAISEDLGGFREEIRKGAFAKSVQESDVRALFNHDPNYVLGRNKSGTLSLVEDEVGLRYEITPPDATWARDLMLSIERGDVDQSSFAFRSVKDKEIWYEQTNEDGSTQVMRSIGEAKLYDVSPVTYPAYEQTVVGLRDGIKEACEKRSGKEREDMEKLIRKLDNVKEPEPVVHSLEVEYKKCELVEKEI